MLRPGEDNVPWSARKPRSFIGTSGLCFYTCADPYPKMPISFHLDARRDAVVVNGTGILSLHDVLQLLDRLAAAGQHVGGKNGIIDTEHASDATITFDSLRRISERVSEMEHMFRQTRWAVVAPSDAMFGIARMYETLRSGGAFEVRAFRNVSDAEAWIRRADPAL